MSRHIKPTTFHSHKLNVFNIGMITEIFIITLQLDTIVDQSVKERNDDAEYVDDNLIQSPPAKSLDIFVGYIASVWGS